MLVLGGLVGLTESLHFILFSINGWGIDLNYCDVEWFSLEVNRDHVVIFEIATKYYVLDSCWL